MAKQSHSRSKSKDAEKIGKGKVTPVQVAFIVDRYLLDNNFPKTRAIFRSEALNLISKSLVQEAPKSLLSLGAILDEYISLKEQKLSLDQEQYRMEQDKFRVDNLLKGLQDAMNCFNASAHLVTPQPLVHLPRQPQPHSINSGITPSNINNEQLPIGSSPGYCSVYDTPAVISTFKPSYSGGYTTSVPNHITNHIVLKRKHSANPSNASYIARKSRRSLTSTNQLLPKGSLAHSQSKGDNQVHNARICNGSKVNGSYHAQTSNVVKCLFAKPDQSPPNNSSDPKTPPLPSCPDAERTTSPAAMCSTVASGKDASQQINSTKSTVISSETISVSPEKQISYYSIARKEHITASPVKVNLKKANRKDHVKERLNFDAPEIVTKSETLASNEISASGCSKEVDDVLDLDFPNLDVLGNFNLSELLSDFDLADEGTRCSSQPSGDSSPDTNSRYPRQSVEVNIGANQVYSQLSSTVTEIISEKDMTSSGSDPVTTVRSITKTIKILSPAKNQSRGSNHEKLPAQDKLD